MSISKKICLLGDSAVGKTSLLHRFISQRFDDQQQHTFGIHVMRKPMSISLAGGTVEVVLLLWDAATEPQVCQSNASYLRGAAGMMLVCDVTRPATLLNISKHMTTLQTAYPGCKYIVAANKSDGEQQILTRGDVQSALRHHEVPFYMTSAKTGYEVEKLFQQVGRLLVS